MTPEQGKVSSKVELYPMSKWEIKWNIERVIPGCLDANVLSPYVAYEEGEEDEDFRFEEDPNVQYSNKHNKYLT